MAPALKLIYSYSDDVDRRHYRVDLVIRYVVFPRTMYIARLQLTIISNGVFRLHGLYCITRFRALQSLHLLYSELFIILCRNAF